MEVKANRLSSSELQQLQEEAAKRVAEERKAREEKTKKKSEVLRLRATDEVCITSSLCHMIT